MFRSIIEFLALLLFFALARSVMSALGRAFQGTVQGQAPRRPTARASADGGMQSAGELRKDPVCGTFVAIASSPKREVNGESYYFCSAECRDKFGRR